MPAPDVVLISTYPPRGVRHGGLSGVASYTANLAHALAGHGARVTVVAQREEGGPERTVDGPVAVERCFRRGPTALATAARAAVRTGAPVVHLQHELFLFGGAAAIPTLLPALARLRRARRLVATMHQVVDTGQVDADFTRLHQVRVPAPLARGALGGVQSTVRRLAHRVIVHEPAFGDLVSGSTVIPHGVEERPRPNQARARRRLGVARDRLSTLCFGFLAPYKGVDTALEAASLAGDQVELVVAGADHPRMAGPDSYGDGLRRRYDGAARFTGHVPEADVASWFAAADVALFAYPQPFSSSGALALALGHRTPVLLSPPLAATTGASSTLVAPGDPTGLADRLVDLAERPEQRQRLGVAVQAMAEGRSWPDVAARHLEVYEEVTHADGSAGRRLRAGQPG